MFISKKFLFILSRISRKLHTFPCLKKNECPRPHVDLYSLTAELSGQRFLSLNKWQNLVNASSSRMSNGLEIQKRFGRIFLSYLHRKKKRMARGKTGDARQLLLAEITHSLNGKKQEREVRNLFSYLHR